ncbi:cilia- and flagella-associated protein 97 [Mixophyes fleayi]|uniref:cilia- and flagella-associated protein 97 n=1 Tax=Mixophyes fleayi TaxID=3061075 RepID=UPI003F4E2F76
MDRYGNLSDDGEVDHSFFDSDADDETGRQVVSTSGPSNHDHVQDKKDFGSGDSERIAETNHGAAKEQSEEGAKESMVCVDTSRPSTAVKSGRSSAQSLRFGTTIPTGVPQIRHEFEDNYYPDEDDSSEEESRSSRPKTAKQTNLGKKNAKYSRDFPSSISSSDTEFSDTASDGHSSKPHHSLKERTLFSLCSPERKLSRQATKDNTDESEDTVTDVTPLSTPDISPIQSFDIAATSEALKSKVKRQENVSQEIYDPDLDGKSDPKSLQDVMDLNQLLKAFMHLDKKEQKSLSVEHPPIRHKKNYSFSNDEVRYIDRENQRLLKELSRQASKTKSQNLTAKKLSTTSHRLYHSALNRQREQQRIERENMALLKRLESVKPTVGMTRSEQFMDYQRQAGYLSSTASSPRPGKTSASRLSSTTSSGGFSRVSSASSRSGHMGSSAALLRPTKSGNVRAAWL